MWECKGFTYFLLNGVNRCGSSSLDGVIGHQGFPRILSAK